MYLTLPIPSSVNRTMTVTVFYGDGSGLPMPYTVTVPKLGCYRDLIQALGTACCLRNDEGLLLAEVDLLYSFFLLGNVKCPFVGANFEVIFRFMIAKFTDIWKVRWSHCLLSRMMNIL